MNTTEAANDEVIATLANASYLEFARELARWAGSHGSLTERDGVLLCAGGSDFAVGGNGVARLDPSVPGAQVLDVADAWFADRGRGYSVATNSHLGDEDVAQAAEDAGLLRIMDAPAMVCDARLPDGEAPDGIELREVRDTAGVDDFIALNDAAYQSLGMPAGVIVDLVRSPARVLAPHIRTILAYEGDTAVAGAEVLLSHGIGGVYYVGTIEAARGRGLAELVTRTVTNLGFDLGAAFVTLQASSMGEPIYRRMGYREIYRYTTYTRFI